ncbi:hypothetical protein BO71DRAFT_424438 [Aspergillus ellipticus CBS 707.79]|uniref:Uncharacterized protein n=1 Tax=Aspergillus ellipticus CBS 707.79 TaxID=1448320 RepID=A0A319EGU6_9EURO|nr:hypothetical protein BO71DRAFT_424438 [Aspergillus ellipticus CBS 707.79]
MTHSTANKAVYSQHALDTLGSSPFPSHHLFPTSTRVYGSHAPRPLASHLFKPLPLPQFFPLTPTPKPNPLNSYTQPPTNLLLGNLIMSLLLEHTPQSEPILASCTLIRDRVLYNMTIETDWTAYRAVIRRDYGNRLGTPFTFSGRYNAEDPCWGDLNRILLMIVLDVLDAGDASFLDLGETE